MPNGIRRYSSETYFFSIKRVRTNAMRQLTPTQLTGSSKATWAGRRLDTIAIGLKQLSNQKDSFRFERDLKEIEKCFHSNFENDHLCRIESVFFGKRMVCWGIMALACEEHITRHLRMNTAKDIRTRNANLLVISWLMSIYVCVFSVSWIELKWF